MVLAWREPNTQINAVITKPSKPSKVKIVASNRLDLLSVSSVFFSSSVVSVFTVCLFTSNALAKSPNGLEAAMAPKLMADKKSLLKIR